MAVINLDENEKIDEIIVQGRTYFVGDIPPAILLRIYNIRTSMMPRILARFFKKHILNQRKAVIQDYLELKNKEVDLKYWSENHIQNFISYIEKRLHDDYETNSEI